MTNLTTICENCNLDTFKVTQRMQNAKYIHLFKFIVGEMNGLPIGICRRGKFIINPLINEKMQVIRSSKKLKKKRLPEFIELIIYLSVKSKR